MDAAPRLMNRMLPIVLMAFTFVALVLTVVASVAYCIRLTGNIVRDAYASDWTTEFLISHLESNNDTWPTSWSDLEDDHAALYPQPCPFTFAEIQERVELSFDVEIAAITNTKYPITFFRLKSGSGANYGGDPNVRIRDYFRSKTRQVEDNSS